jgi:mannose-6-phosphate isomerase-like protein (cupin superfamily)
METINGSTVIPAPPAGEPVTLGPGETQGAYRVLSGTIPPGEPGPPLHTHPDTDELFYVGSGEATFQLGDREVKVTMGGTVYVPRGTVHTVSNSGEAAITGLILISPGDAEHQFVPVESS